MAATGKIVNVKKGQFLSGKYEVCYRKNMQSRQRKGDPNRTRQQLWLPGPGGGLPQHTLDAGTWLPGSDGLHRKLATTQPAEWRYRRQSVIDWHNNKGSHCSRRRWPFE